MTIKVILILLMALMINGGMYFVAHPKAEMKPFSVYRSGDYCVFVAGFGATASVVIDENVNGRCQ